MGVSIAEEFEVRASPDRVFAWLIDPSQVVQCLPGAELLETPEDQTFLGRMRVKVGPVSASFRGRARFDELDAVARRVRLSGEGQDTGGAGSAKLTMISVVEALPDGGSRVKVQSDVEVVGKLVQFGRGLMEEVSRQMFKQFAECVKAKLEAEQPVDHGIPASDSTSNTTASMSNSPASPSNRASPALVTAPQPVSMLPLLWRAFIAWLRRLFGGSP